MPKTQVNQLKRLKLLITGNPGIGKTYFIGTAVDDPRSSPVLLCNFAGNPQTVRSKVADDKMVVWNCAGIKEFENILTWLRAGQSACALRDEMGLPDGVNFQTLAVDTLAEFQRRQAIEIMGPDYAGLTTSKHMEFKDWNLMWARSVNLARIVGDPEWPTHVILTVHIKTGEDGIGRTYEPMLYGQSDFEVPGYMPAVAWLTWTQDLARNLQPKDSTRVLVFTELYRHVNLKEQYEGKLPQIVGDPTMTKLLDYLEDEHD
jgi:hypothetical protein